MDKPKPAFDWKELDRIRVEYAAPADGFSVPDYMERYGCSRNVARKEISRLLSQGIIECVGMRGIPNGGSAKFYRYKQASPAGPGTRGRAGCDGANGTKVD